MKKIATILLLTALTAGTAFANNLSADARVTRELTAAAVADEIRNQCNEFSANMIVAVKKMYALQSYAKKSLGVDDSQIKAFLDNKDEQARIRGLRDSYLSSNGVIKGDRSSYCALGEREQAQGTLIGSLLK